MGFTAKDGYQGLISVIVWIKNRRITKVVESENGKVKIFIDDEYIEVEEKVLRLLEDYATRKALSAVIYEPLENKGIDKFATGSQKDGLVIVEKKDAVYFASPTIQEQLIHENITETILQVVSPSFNEENKWKVSDGTSTFFTDITDTDFIDRVQRNEESFAKDDLLTVNIRKRQWLTEKGTMKTDYVIEKVVEHKSAAVQMKLNLY